MLSEQNAVLPRWTQRIPPYVTNEQRIVVARVLVFLLVLLAVMTARFGWLLAVELLGTPLSRLSVDQLLNLFSFVLLELIGLELVESVQLFLAYAHVHVEFVILIALITVSRKMTILNLTPESALSLLGIAALVITLAGGYFLMKGLRPGPEE